MVANQGFGRFVLMLMLMLGATTAMAQNELRDTFFKTVDAQKAAAEAANAQLLAPNSYGRGLKEYRDAEVALERGRNIQTVRSNADLANGYFRTATTAAELAQVKLAQVLKSRQDAANARARAAAHGGLRRGARRLHRRGAGAARTPVH